MSDRLRIFFRQNRNIIMSYVATFLLLAAVSIFRPGFGLGSVDGMRSLLVEASVIAIVSLGQTLVILCGGIDLSLPWTLAGTAVMMTVLTEGEKAPLIWVVPLLLVGCLIIGFINGALITYLEVSPVIVTLAMGSILLGAVSGIGIGSSGVIFGTTPALVSSLSGGRFLEVPNLVWVMIILAIIATIVLSYSKFGRRLYAIGTSREVSLYSGLDVKQVTIVIYMMSAFLGGVAGILLAGQFGRAYLGMGDQYLFISVAAVVIGGTSVLGGSGHYLGTLAGALLLTVLTATLPVLHLARPFQLIIFGLVILVAVYFSTTQQARET